MRGISCKERDTCGWLYCKERVSFGGLYCINVLMCHIRISVGETYVHCTVL